MVVFALLGRYQFVLHNHSLTLKYRHDLELVGSPLIDCQCQMLLEALLLAVLLLLSLRASKNLIDLMRMNHCIVLLRVEEKHCYL